MDLLVAHMVGDFLFQNRWMAINKTNNVLVAFIHASIYALSVMLICGWADWKFYIVLISHFIIDHFRIAKYWRRFFSRDEEFSWMITADQSMHLLILWALSLIK